MASKHAPFPLVGLLLLLEFPSPVDGAINVFVFGDYVLDHPWGTFALTGVVIALSIMLELLMHAIHHKITNQYSQIVIEHVLSELQMLGIISLCLVFAINFLPQSATALILLFDWAHMVLFIFAMFFLTYVATLFGVTKLTWRNWARYENEAAAIFHDKAAGRQVKTFALFPLFERFREQISQINSEYADIGLTRYLKKTQRKNLLFVVELNKTSWASLLVLSLINSLRGWILLFMEPPHYVASTSGGSSYNCDTSPPCGHNTWPWNTIVFIITIGVLPLCALYIISIRLRIGFKKFTSSAGPGIGGGHHEAHSHDHGGHGGHGHGHDEKAEPLLEGGWDHHDFFFFRSPDVTLQGIQITVIFIVYYLSLLIISYISESKKQASSQGNILPWVLFACSLIPPLLFMIELPNVLQLMTILSSTGNLLDEELLEDIYSKDYSNRQELVDRAKEENLRFQLEEEGENEEEERKKRMMHRQSVRSGNLLGADKKLDIISELALRPTPVAVAPTSPDAPPKSFAELMKERAAQLAASTSSPTSPPSP
eukprot:TRINITY_DN1991_c0_g1_i1.p1 TRINITY_DN1991_c0_g1~~TRINITY_DN1991_c0_g1_i1.p1  ORF type:complete len:549 (-),score=83.65 TRINITY_DN1991_c0_g1_i1:256-1881(-)